MYAFFLIIHVCLYTVVNGYNYIEKGEACWTPDGQEAICVHFNDCPSAIEAIRRRKPPETCSYEGKFPIVCCADSITSSVQPEVNDRLKNSESAPTVDNPSFDVRFGANPPFDVRSGDTEDQRSTQFDSADLGLRKCRDYQIQTNKIFVNDSVDASAIKQYAHMALLGYVDEGNKIIWKCTGSLISEKFVLTTARCAKPLHIGKLKYVQLGQHDINSNTSDIDVQNFLVNETFVHPDFEYLSIYNDIGLVELNNLVEFTQFISPACVTETSDLGIAPIEAVGYGLIQLRDKLGKHPVQLSPIEDCKQIYASNSQTRSGNVELTCTRVLEENAECYVDVGGPLQLINTRYEFGNFTEIVGIYLFGSSCGSSGDLFLNILPYVSWIQQIVWPNSE